MQSVIKIENLRKYFRYGIRGIGIQAVDGISLEVEEGEVFGLLGPIPRVGPFLLNKELFAGLRRRPNLQGLKLS